MPSAKKGFTLIELIIAISIIGIISAIGFVSYSQAQLIARDAKRKQDLRAIATAMELYYQANKFYPNQNINSWYFSNAGEDWIPNLDSKYINRIPADPVNTPGCAASAKTDCYVYSYWVGEEGGCPPLGQMYALAIQLENTSDPDRNAAKPFKWCDGRLTSGGGKNWDWSPNLFMITSW